MTSEVAGASWQIRPQRDAVGTVRIYRKLLWRRIFTTIYLSACILAVLVGIGLVLLKNVGPLPFSKIAGCVALVGIASGLLWLIVFELTYRITLTDDGIAASRWGWKRALACSEIAGRRETRGSRGRRLLKIVPSDPQAKPLRLSPGIRHRCLFRGLDQRAARSQRRGPQGLRSRDRPRSALWRDAAGAA